MNRKYCIRRPVEAIVLFLFGGGVYALLEVLYRGFTHWTMLVLSGSVFLIIDAVNRLSGDRLAVPVQALLGGVFATVGEFLAGLLLNRCLGWNVWDYSDTPGNILGQICPMYTAMWCGLALISIYLGGFLRKRMFQTGFSFF